MKENPNLQEKKEMKNLKGSFFEVPGIPIPDPKGELGAKSEEKLEEKKTSADTVLFERKERKEIDFKAPGEPETDHTEKSWAKPEKNIEEKAAERTEEIRQKVVEETREGETSEGREKEEKEVKEKEDQKKEVKEKEEREKEAKEKEEREKEAGEREAGEREAREEKRTVYTMEKRLTRSKTERMIFGVCGGLGEYLGTDPTLVRLAFALFTLFSGGIGLVLYIILAIIVPLEKNVEMFPSSRK